MRTKDLYLDLTQKDLVWAEEFDHDGALDSSKWNFDTGTGKSGWGNREEQTYGDGRDVCEVRDGRLVIRSYVHTDGSLRSARIHTYGKASWTYGTFVVRARLPKGRGTWPAIWLLPDVFPEAGGWPGCGEIDVMEHRGNDEGVIHFSLHSRDHNHRLGSQRTEVARPPGVVDGFHDYFLDWEPDVLRFGVDGGLLAEFPRESATADGDWPFQQPYHLVINLALGGFFGGELHPQDLPAEFEIEYARVYQGTGT